MIGVAIGLSGHLELASAFTLLLKLNFGLRLRHSAARLGFVHGRVALSGFSMAESARHHTRRVGFVFPRGEQRCGLTESRRYALRS